MDSTSVDEQYFNYDKVKFVKVTLFNNIHASDNFDTNTVLHKPQVKMSSLKNSNF